MIKRLLIVFGQPETDDVPGYLTEVATAIKGFSEGTQDEACTLLMKTYRGRKFPTPAQCREACEHITEDRRQDALRRPTPVAYPEWQPEAIKRADDLIRGDLGQRAAKEGWIGPLHVFCRKRGRLVMPHETGKLVAIARGFEEAYREVSNRNLPFDGELRKLGEAILARHDELAGIAHGQLRK